MSLPLKKSIKSLLESIMVFEPDFKDKILVKIESDSGSIDLLRLKEVLLEAEEWQQNFLNKKMKTDPEFINTIKQAKQKVEQSILDKYQLKLKKEDKQQIDNILYRISSI